MNGLDRMQCSKIYDGAAVSETMGVILLLALVTVGITIVLTLGMHTITDAKTDANYNGVEQAFTVAESKLSKARFSTSIFQEAPFELRDSTVTINDSWDNSHIIVYDIDGVTEIYNGSMGTISCQVGDRQIAYQDGGIWTLYPDGGSIMISPPVFDYNGVTLTLPVTRIKGDETMAASGNSQVVINVNSSSPTLIYPKEGVGGNPVPPGHAINLSIKSDYYQAWAEYINERTRAQAEVDAKNKTVNVSLKSGIPVQSGLVSSGFTTKSMETGVQAPVKAFKLNLVLRNTGNDYTITYGVPSQNQNNVPDPDLLMTVSRTTTNDNHEYAYIEYKYTHGTQTELFSTMIPFDRKADGSIDIDFMSRTIEMTYEGDPSVTWGNDMNVFDSSTMRIDYDDTTYTDVVGGDVKTLHDVTEHYLWVMAKYDQQNSDQYEGPFYEVIGKQKYDGGQSTFQLSYVSSEDIKYLYITEGVLYTKLSLQSI
ncbi:DUF7289 family protein [Methanocella sp. MCL-LM]|uniref:DUF7289 family protein n=1 Tax=Methanocella sp. MCL-LM TaxID=3412035 RepID=UPI003C771D9F